MKFNRYINVKDVIEAQNFISADRWEEKYPQSVSNCSHFYDEDAQVKWYSIIRTFNEIYDKNRKKIVDLGCGLAPMMWYFADHGHQVFGVDNLICDNEPLKKSRLFFGNRKIKLKSGGLLNFINMDGYAYLDNIPDKNIDCIVDACSVTHFGMGYGQYRSWNSTGDMQFYKLFEISHRKLKKNGLILITSDVKKGCKSGEFLDPGLIIEHASNIGFELVNGKFDHNNFSALPSPRDNGQVACFAFRKKEILRI